MALTDVLPDMDMDFSELDDEGSTAPAESGPLTGSRGTKGRAPLGGAPSGEERIRRPRRPTQKRLDALTSKMSEQMFMVGSGFSFVRPVTGYYVCQESHNYSKA